MVVKMKYRELLKKTTDRLIKENKEESVAIYLLEHVTKISNPNLYAMLDEECDEKIIEDYYVCLDKHIQDNVPVQYIIGKSYFYGYEYIVNEDVLIPRYETEELVENILYRYDDLFLGSKINVVDVGTGSGCIGVTLALEETNMNVTITDISPKALDVARRNADKYSAKVKIMQGDMLEPLKGMKFDMLISNPPYIPDQEEVMSLVKDNEPNLALFGGDDGMKFYRIILSQCKELLNEKFMIAFEHAFDKGDEMKELTKKYFPNAKIEILKDMQGKDRMTIITEGLK